MDAAQRLGLATRAVHTALDEICDGAPPWIERIGEIGFDARPTELPQQLITRRLLELRGDRPA